MLPLALLVGFSRVYNGMHYPATCWLARSSGPDPGWRGAGPPTRCWQWAGRRWFPLWHAQLPRLIQPQRGERRAERGEQTAEMERQWLHVGFVFIGALLLIHLAFVASGKIELSEDEAYQWVWSKHLALSYYSKPPLIACVQFLGTHLWGDNSSGFDFSRRVIAAILSFLVLRFLARETNGRVAFMVVLILSLAPLMALGSILMTVDPLSVLFWTAAMIAGWRAVAAGRDDPAVAVDGILDGAGIPEQIHQPLSMALLGFVLCALAAGAAALAPGRARLALALAALCSLPVLVWNAQHGWITVQHVASDGGWGQPWRRTFILDFLEGEAGLLHPVFFAAAVWAALAFWRQGRKNVLQLFLFSMGAPLFLFYLLVSLRSRVDTNWIAPSVVPLFCLMAVYWMIAGRGRGPSPNLCFAPAPAPGWLPSW